MANETAAAAPHRILVVDDEPDITALVAYHLAKEGYRVTTAGTGADALRSAREERPDLVVLDLMLPGHSGFEVLAELRRRDETRDVGVLLLTARKDEPDRIKGLSLGADDYLAKPFSPKELVLRVGAILRRLSAPPVAAGGRLVGGPIVLDLPAARIGVAGAARHPDANRRHARPAVAYQTRRGGRLDRNRTGRGLSVPRAGRPAEAPHARAAARSYMRLATRLFASIGLLVAAAVVGSILATDLLLRRHLEQEIATELEREGRLVAALAPSDSTRWPDYAALAGARLSRRVTLIDPGGRVRGDTEFGRDALPRLENHSNRPEVRAAYDSARGVE